MGFAVDILDLSRLTSEFGKTIHPCKSCVSTAMPLCHWPCSCYPNYSLGQTDDWMNEIYPLWVAAHGILIVTPVIFTWLRERELHHTRKTVTKGQRHGPAPAMFQAPSRVEYQFATLASGIDLLWTR